MSNTLFLPLLFTMKIGANYYVGALNDTPDGIYKMAQAGEQG